jgi:hypothetical protein
MKIVWIILMWLASFLMTVILLSVASADEIPKTKFVDAIIGEAEGEPYQGKLAVACAIRNRGTLQGVYGVNAPRVRQHKYSTKVFVDSVRAYEESAHPESCEFIDGASFWEGTSFKTPYWAKNMVVTATIGRQRFYRE